YYTTISKVTEILQLRYVYIIAQGVLLLIFTSTSSIVLDTFSTKTSHLSYCVSLSIFFLLFYATITIRNSFVVEVGL
ncbi:hypothetical protein, partial [Streptococcus mutans]|uniref:hypothetical protein n=1 Tax=Streptococcus mutans TaxID=1309 RepID=UPI001C3F80D6